MRAAGGGRGKTRVLTTRIAWLLATGQALPLSILAVTFTNKAAKEMLLRLSTLTPINTRGMWIGTFHGLCNRMLRAHYRDANLPQLFQIMDTQDQLALIKRLYKAHNIDDERFPARQLQYFIASAKEEGLRPSAVEAGDELARRQVEHYAMYEAMCQREGAVDFAELLLRSYELLRDHAGLREHYQRRFSHLLVDEFQDTNKLQYAWLRILAGPDAAVFAVGDDDQSIYAFRGANIANMQHFERDFGAAERPVTLIKLEQNYRSHGHILDAANALIRFNQARLGKNLWTADSKGEPIRAFAALSDLDEAAFIVDVVKGLAADGVALSECAVLYRSNAQSRVLEHALFNAAIPYRVYGGMRFFERAEVKHALAYLRLLASPVDDGAFLRVVNFPPRGIGARTLETLQDTARARGTSLWEAASAGVVTGKSGNALAAFVKLIEAMQAGTAGLPLPEAVEHVNEASGLIAHYRTEKDGEDRLENLEELVNAADSFLREADLAVDAPIAVPEADIDTEPPVGASDPLTAFLARDAPAVSHARAKPDAARPGALSHRVALCRRDSARARAVAVCADAPALDRSRHRAMGCALGSFGKRGAAARIERVRVSDRMADRPERAPREVRRRRHRRRRGPRQRCSGAGQFPRSGPQVARARVREARGCLGFSPQAAGGDGGVE